MKVRFKKLTPEATIPSKAHTEDAGFDLVATSVTLDEAGNYVYGTGIAVEIPDGYVGLAFPRSSIAKYGISLTNAVGVIDSCYRGEIMFKFKKYSRHVTELYHVGDRIAQLIIMPYPEIEFEQADELSQTSRGEGGYGSSGR